MNKYRSFYTGSKETVETEAETSFDGHRLAIAKFQKLTRRKVHPWNVTTLLIEKDGKPYVHNPAELS